MSTVTRLNFAAEARRKMKTGVDQLADAVKVTLGPKGRNVTIRRNDPQRTIVITKDGVSVARSVRQLSDDVEDMGAQIVKMTAEKTAQLAGDGTTTSTVLAQVIIREGLGVVDRGANPVDVKKGMESAVEIVVDSLRKQSKTITDENLRDVAAIAANNDQEIGTLVADAMQKVGPDGVIYLDISKTGETYVKHTEGIVIDRGYISPYFVNVKEKMTVEFEDAYILFSERKISILKDIEPTLNLCIRNKRPLLIIAEDVDGDALQTLLLNAKQNGAKFAAIKQPGYGNMQIQMMEDIALMCGGQIVSQSLGQAWEKVDHTFLGSADKIVITSASTTILGARGKKSAIEGRIAEIRALIDNSVNDFEKEKLKKQRLAKLTNGTAVIYVGGQTEVEAGEKKDRIDDAICATRSAQAEGILPGGGVGYIRALAALPKEFKNKDENEGLMIIKTALEAPLRQMLANGGETRADAIINKIYESSEEDFGYNVKTSDFGYMVASGVIDPVKVSRVALENACSVGGMFLTTECAIFDETLTK